MRSHLFREYLEKEFLKENILICLSGAQMGWINEIKKMPKISLHCHFKVYWDVPDNSHYTTINNYGTPVLGEKMYYVRKRVQTSMVFINFKMGEGVKLL